MFSSSTQEERDNLYGRSKKEGRQLLEQWASKNQAQFTGFVIPNVFGPFGNPYYNSVVATFCHQLTHNEEPKLEVDGEIKLIYVGELVKHIINKIQDNSIMLNFNIIKNELTFYLVAPYILRKGYRIIILLIIMSFLLRLIIYNVLCFQHDPWTYRFFPTEIMFFLLGYLSYRINLKLKEKSIPMFINIFILIFITFFTIIYQFLPAIRISYFPFSLIEMVYFLSIILSIPVLFNFMKNSRLDNQIGELSYPVYISHMLIIEVCSAVPFVFFKSSWFIALITLIVAYLLNKMVATPFESYRQSRLKIIPAVNS